MPGDGSSKRILFFHSKVISLIGIPYALHSLGYELVEMEYRPGIDGGNEEEIRRLTELVGQSGGDMVVTYDFLPSVSEACERCRIRYLAMVYDCPQVEVYRKEAGNEYTTISVFDRDQYRYLQERGVVKHLICHPLAADVDLFSLVRIDREDELKYAADISFVGRMYNRSYICKIREQCGEEIREECRALVQASSGRWGKEGLLFGTASDHFIEEVYGLFGDSAEKWNVDKRYFVESSFLAPICNSEERRKGLNMASRYHSVVLYSDGGGYEGMSDHIQIKGPLEYGIEMPKAFYLSKINLNITSASIRSGIPQRVWDIMAVGGFCLSNAQPEMEKYFEIGKDLVVYHDFEEMMALIDYYLSHEEERLQIAVNGYRKVKETGNMIRRMKEVMEDIGVCHENAAAKGI